MFQVPEISANKKYSDTCHDRKTWKEGRLYTLSSDYKGTNGNSQIATRVQFITNIRHPMINSNPVHPSHRSHEPGTHICADWSMTRGTSKEMPLRRSVAVQVWWLSITSIDWNTRDRVKHLLLTLWITTRCLLSLPWLLLGAACAPIPLGWSAVD